MEKNFIITFILWLTVVLWIAGLIRSYNNLKDCSEVNVFDERTYKSYCKDEIQRQAEEAKKSLYRINYYENVKN